jgi:CRP-like cAMP-binding protein
MPADAKELVRRSSLFASLSPELFEVVLARAVPRSVEEGAFFFMQGDPATHAYVLTGGRVKMHQVTTGGQQITLRILHPGQTFAGIALLHPESGYPVSAQAIEDSSALAWDTAVLRELAAQDPSLAINAMQLMHGYVTEMQDRVRELTSERVEQRIARSLLRLAAGTGRKQPEGVLIDLPLSRQDLAEMTGTTLYTVSRTLSEWERQGLLDLGRERVVIREPHGLVRIAEDLRD